VALAHHIQVVVHCHCSGRNSSECLPDSESRLGRGASSFKLLVAVVKLLLLLVVVPLVLVLVPSLAPVKLEVVVAVHPGRDGSGLVQLHSLAGMVQRTMSFDAGLATGISQEQLNM
jgi:hypothetical protein